jgi:protein-tyrosine phosphatase
VRALQWEGCCNIRDLGGLSTEDGSETRFRAVVRADNVTLLSDTGWRSLRDYGVRRIVDLRYREELEADRPHAAGVEVVHAPLASEVAVFHQIDKLLAGVTEPVAWRRGNYLAVLERVGANFARAVTAIARAPEGAVLVHCAGGVDRTGLVAALLLRVSRVGIDAISEDYAESEQNWLPFVSEWIDATSDEDERTKRRLLAVMPAAAMHDVLVEVDNRYRGADGYLRGVGVEQEDLDRVRTRLLG